MPAFSLTSYLLTALGPYARRLWFAAAALCVLALGTLGLVRRSLSDAPPPPPPPVPVRVARVEARDVARQAESVGTVRPLRDVVVRTQIDGQLMRLHVREGQINEFQTDTNKY